MIEYTGIDTVHAHEHTATGKQEPRFSTSEVQVQAGQVSAQLCTVYGTASGGVMTRQAPSRQAWKRD